MTYSAPDPGTYPLPPPYNAKFVPCRGDWWPDELSVVQLALFKGSRAFMEGRMYFVWAGKDQKVLQGILVIFPGWSQRMFSFSRYVRGERALLGGGVIWGEDRWWL